MIKATIKTFAATNIFYFNSKKEMINGIVVDVEYPMSDGYHKMEKYEHTVIGALFSLYGYSTVESVVELEHCDKMQYNSIKVEAVGTMRMLEEGLKKWPIETNDPMLKSIEIEYDVTYE